LFNRFPRPQWRCVLFDLWADDVLEIFGRAVFWWHHISRVLGKRILDRRRFYRIAPVALVADQPTILVADCAIFNGIVGAKIQAFRIVAAARRSRI